MLPIKTTPAGLMFQVHIQPKSSRNAVVGVHGEALKIKLTAPPVDGAANAQCIKFLAKCLDVPKSSVAIASGQASRRKQIRIDAAETDVPRLKQRLEALATG